MIGKLLNVAGALSLAALLALGGLVGFLVLTGRLDAERADLMVQVLRGELQPQETAEVIEDAAEDVPPEETRQQSGDEVRALRKRAHLERLEIERSLEDLQAQRRLLDHVLHQIVQEQEKLETDKDTFEQQREQIVAAARDEGFQKELSYVRVLSPKQAKEHLLRVWKRNETDAVRLLIELDVRQGKRILEEFKTEEELNIQTELLEQIRSKGLEGYASASGKTAGDESP